MNRRWVCNASPIIALGHINCLEILPALCKSLIIPEAVAVEIKKGESRDQAVLWMENEGDHFVRKIDSIPRLIENWDLGRGESEVLGFSLLNREYESIIDDRAARNCAHSLGIQFRGTLSLIALAKKEGLLSEVRPHLELLHRSGFRIRKEIFAHILHSCGEESTPE